MPPSTTSSWLALVASAALGVAAVAMTAEVRAEGVRSRGPLRLVIQAFDADGSSRKPVSSVQRAVTPEELARGVKVDVIDLSTTTKNTRLVAWVEPGEADLALDGRVAKPGRRSVRGQAMGAAGKPLRITLG